VRERPFKRAVIKPRYGDGLVGAPNVRSDLKTPWAPCPPCEIFWLESVRAAACPQSDPPLSLPPFCARSSAVEHYLDMVGVTGSIPVARTTAAEAVGG
jgi:hypothetical protein